MYKQTNRFATVTTPLGSDTLLFSRMTGYEEMSRLFEYEVDCLVENKSLGPIVNSGFPTDKILGQAMLVSLSLPKGTRYFHGLVTDFRHHGAIQDDLLCYRAILRPWLWFLTRTSNCRIFQDLSVPDIIKQVFELNEFHDFSIETTRSYPPRNYCVQYRESDFNFVSRLMEYEGIFYYFKHDDHKHTLVIGDAIGAYQNIPGYESIPYHAKKDSGQKKQDHIFQWHTAHQVKSGSYVLNDYDFEKPKSNLITQFRQEKQHRLAKGEVYDYPGNYLEPPHGETYTNIRLDELHSQHETIQGKGNVLGMAAGQLFKLKEHYLSPENTQHILTANRFYIESSDYHSGSSASAQYECDFTAIRSKQPFRPRRLTPVPFVHGPQTATVVGKEGEEIWTDQYGRIKVKFHWDRADERHENSSCWIRVAYPVAGKTWGWVSLPRIGQEVVVNFLEGNPDRPLITGSVYNALQMPPYTLPGNQTQSGIKSRSSKIGHAAHFNELRFEDKKGQEHIYFHAEKELDMLVEHDRREWVQHDRHLRVEHDRTEEVRNDSSSKVDRDRTEGTGRKLSQTIGEEHTVKVGDAYHLTTGKSQYFQSGRQIVLESGQELTIRSSGGFIKIDASGITIQGKVVNINTGGSPGTGFPIQANVAKNAMLATDVNNPAGSSATEAPPKNLAPDIKPLPATPHVSLPDSMAGKVKQAASQGLPTIPLNGGL